MAEQKFGISNVVNTSNKQKNNVDINLGDDVVKYYLMPSLQHVSVSNIIITLWNQADIKYKILTLFNEFEDYGYFGTSMYQSFLKIEDKVLDKLSQLGVPDRIRKILSNIVHPIGREIFDWIEYQDKYIFNNGYCLYQRLKPIAINYIDNLVWTPRGVIDYKETAKTLLAKEEKLFVAYKYNIACNYSFEDHIAIIAPKIINTELNLRYIERQAMVYFWTAHITGDFNELNWTVSSYNTKYNTNYSINECIFTVIIDNGRNQVAIQYIWDKLSNEEKSRQLVPAIKNTSNADIRCFLLSQMNKEQEKEVFKTNDASKILIRFLDDWLWGEYFLPTVHHIWDIMSSCDYLTVLEYVVSIMKKNHEDIEKYNRYKATLKELWRFAPKHLKEYVFKHKNGYHGQNIFFELLYNKNIDVIQLILADISDEQKKQIIFSTYGIYKCNLFVTSNQWDLLEMSIDHILSSKEDVECFKQTLHKEKGREIAVHFMRSKEWSKTEEYMQWVFKSDDDIRKFRHELSFSEICTEIFESIVENNKADFTEIEHFFKWCSLGNEERVAKFKGEIPEHYFRKIICQLIENDKYELLEQILNWCFVNDKEQIAQFKQYFYCDHKSFLTVELAVNLIKQDDQLRSFEKFLNWCFINEEEINKFKTCILHPTQGTVGIFAQLFCGDMLKLAEEFVNWYCNSSQIKINNFKNQLMVDDEMKYFYDLGVQSVTEAEVIAWFNPSIETVIRFKEKFKNKLWLRNFLPALDKCVQEKQNNQDKALNKDVTYSLQN